MISLDQSDLAIIRELPIPPKDDLYITASHHRLNICGEKVWYTRSKPWELPQPLGIIMKRDNFDLRQDPIINTFWRAWHIEPWGKDTSFVGLADIKPKINDLRRIRAAIREAAAVGVPVKWDNPRLMDVLDQYGAMLDGEDKPTAQVELERIAAGALTFNGAEEKNEWRMPRYAASLTRRLLPDLLIDGSALAAVYQKHPKWMRVSGGKPFLFRLSSNNLHVVPMLDKEMDSTLPESTVTAWALAQTEFAVIFPIWLNRLLAKQIDGCQVTLTMLDCGESQLMNQPSYAFTRIRIAGHGDVTEIFFKLELHQHGTLRPFPVTPPRKYEEAPDWATGLFQGKYVWNDLPENIRTGGKDIPTLAMGNDDVYLLFDGVAHKPGKQCWMHPLMFFERRLRMEIKKRYGGGSMYWAKDSRARKEFYALLTTYQRWLSRQAHSTDVNTLIHTAYAIALGPDCAADELPLSALTNALSLLTSRA